MWVCVHGPAEKIFANLNLKRCFIKKISRAHLKKVEWLLTGSSWSSRLEHNARIFAKKEGVYSIAILDHWANYGQRFVTKKITSYPDEIWVVDKHAKKIARKIFFNCKITQIPDYYKIQRLKQIKPIKKNTPKNLLYLLEPIRSNWGKSEAGEFQALKYFFKKINNLRIGKIACIKLKTHPSESIKKYNNIIKKIKTPKLYLAKKSLEEEISAARWVVGCQTYALTLAVAAKRKVFCSLPPGAPKNILPYKQIIMIRKLNAKKNKI